MTSISYQTMCVEAMGTPCESKLKESFVIFLQELDPHLKSLGLPDSVTIDGHFELHWPSWTVSLYLSDYGDPAIDLEIGRGKTKTFYNPGKLIHHLYSMVEVENTWESHNRDLLETADPIVQRVACKFLAKLLPHAYLDPVLIPKLFFQDSIDYPVAFRWKRKNTIISIEPTGAIYVVACGDRHDDPQHELPPNSEHVALRILLAQKTE